MIPKIIHQVWIGPLTMPEREKVLCQKVQTLHSDYDYKFWTSDNVGAEIEDMPTNVRSAYTRMYERGDYVFACDVLRIWLLWKYGGFYLDVDMDFKQRLDLFLNYEGVFFFHGFLDSLEKTEEHDEFKDLTIPNTLFFGKPGLEPLRHCLHSISDDTHWFGPSWFGETIKDYYGLENEITHQTVFDELSKDGILYYNFADFESMFAKHLGLASWFPEVRHMLEQGIENINCPYWDTLKTVTNRDHLNRYLESLQSPTICEVGVRVADNFKSMLTPNVEKAVAVDIWRDTGNSAQNDWLSPQSELDNQYRHVFRMYFNNPKVKIIREFSAKAAEFFDDETFDFVYIDADHSYEGCLEDIKAWYPKVKSGGVIGGHDYVEAVNSFGVKFGVIEAVAEFRRDNNISDSRFHTTEQEEHFASWFIYKK